MALFDGLERVRQMTPAQRTEFESFFQKQLKRLLPTLADLALCLNLIGTIIFIVILGTENGGGNGEEGGVETAHWIYLSGLVLLIALHRWPPLRRRPPLMVYLIFGFVGFFHYLGFVAQGGELPVMFRLFFFVSSLGIVTLSFRHTLILVSANLGALTLACFILASVSGQQDTWAWLEPVLFNWFTLSSTASALVTALVVRRFFRTIFAWQFLLTHTLHSLKHTEALLIQGQKHQALSHMAKGLLHEILNPLNGSTQALNYARQVYQPVSPDDEVAGALDDALAQQNRVVQIIQDLRRFSESPPESKPQTNPLSPLVEEALNLCRSELKGIDVQMQLPRDLAAPCYPSALTQVFVNLLMNSAEALRDTANPGIRIAADHKEGHTRLYFRDNGCGITEAQQQTLSQPGAAMATSDAPATGYRSGLGLGLSICQTIMRHHQGDLVLSSNPDQGTLATVTLPDQ